MPSPNPDPSSDPSGGSGGRPAQGRAKKARPPRAAGASSRGSASGPKRSAATKAAAVRSGTRSEQKERTRRALLDAALARLAGEQAFTDISIREITGDAGVVPATFYRHFADMGEVGLVLVDESFTELRQVMRAIRAQPVPTAELVENSVTTFLGYAREHPMHFRFIAKERYGGSRALRMALGREIQLWVSELATDLARFNQARDLTTDELMAVASLVIGAVWSGTERVVDVGAGPAGDAQCEGIRAEVELQVNVALAGAIFYPAYRHGSFSMSAARMVANVRKELEKSRKRAK
ncbi:MAG: HTH-type transcriptional repressor FabR [Microthrixaceae bacterium]